MVIYKITNLVNNKIYIGQTSNFELRIKQHMNSVNFKNVNMPIKHAIIKYGWNNFKTEIIEKCCISDINEKEVYWIKYYNSRVPNGYNIKQGGESNIGDDNPRARLTNKEVEEIRNIFASKTLFIRDVYSLYNDRISFSAFEKIWQGITWKNIKYEVYTDDNKKYHNTKSKSLSGALNGNGVFSDEDVLRYRILYKTLTSIEIYNSFSITEVKYEAFWQMLRGQSYKHIPSYKKTKKQWILP